MAFRKLVGSYKDYNLATHIIEDGYLAVDVDTGSLRIGDGVTAGGTVIASAGGGGGGSASGLNFGDTTSSTISIADGGVLNLVGTGGITATVSGDTLTIDGSGVSGSGGSSSLGDLTAVGSTLSSPSNADLTINSSGGNVNIEGLTINGTNISTTDSSAGVEITDGTGTLNIAATGATLPAGSKVQEQPISLLGKTSATAKRPVEIVPIFVSDGSSNLTDTQILAKTADLELEFNGTVEEVPVFTEAGQNFTLANGAALTTQYSDSVTLFQF